MTTHPSNLADQQCETSSAAAPPPSLDEIAAMQAQIPDWTLLANGDERLERVFTFDTFGAAWTFANEVAAEAETQNHHPKITLEWGRATIAWQTHVAGGVRRNDFIMAARADAIADRLASAPPAARVIHFEILGDDPAALADFYTKSLGWTVQTGEVAEDYWLATTRPDKGPGIDGALMERQFAQPVINTSLVDSLDDTLAKIAANGGKIVVGPAELPGIGTYAYCEDPEGNLFGVIQEPTTP